MTVCIEELHLDPNIANEQGDTALHVAHSGGIVRYLATHGANLTAKNKRDQTPLAAALARIDPHVEPTHYWGTIEPNLRAIDIWNGAETDRNKGYGREMMRVAHERCVTDPAVTAIVIDPLASNTRAIAFCQRLGYVMVERRMFGDDDCLVLRLTHDAWREMVVLHGLRAESQAG